METYFCDAIMMRSQKIDNGWSPYDRGSQIAIRSAIVCDHMETYFCDRLRSCDRDRRRSQKIEPCSISCDPLRSIAIVRSYGSRCAIETHPIIFRVLSHDSTLVCLMVGTVYVAIIISLSFGGIYGGSCSL